MFEILIFLSLIAVLIINLLYDNYFYKCEITGEKLIVKQGVRKIEVKIESITQARFLFGFRLHRGIEIKTNERWLQIAWLTILNYKNVFSLLRQLKSFNSDIQFKGKLDNYLESNNYMTDYYLHWGGILSFSFLCLLLIGLVFILFVR